MTKILVLQGANLNWLGLREPEKYGSTTAAELDARIHAHLGERDATAVIAYCNVEGEAIDRLYDAQRSGVAAVVLNPAGFSYAGYALRDCIQGISVPVVEIHITNHFARDIHSVTAAAAKGVVMGFGIDGYFMALDAALRLGGASTRT